MSNRGRIGGVSAASIGVIARNVAVVHTEERLEQGVVGATCTGDLAEIVDDVGHVVVSTHAVMVRDRADRASR